MQLKEKSRIILRHCTLFKIVKRDIGSVFLHEPSQDVRFSNLPWAGNQDGGIFFILISV